MSVLPDEIDRKILAELQRDASQSLDEIARKVGSSKTPVWNRIRKLRDAGIIGQQTVVLNAEALGFEACFFVLIRTSEHEAGVARGVFAGVAIPRRGARGAQAGGGCRLYS